MSVDTDISTSLDLLGKHVDDLQSGITVGDDEITGTVKHVTGYTGFSGDVSEQTGNYLVLHFAVPNVPGVTLTAELVGGIHGPVTLDTDGILISRISSNTQKVKITASKTGWASVTKTFALTNLELEEG